MKVAWYLLFFLTFITSIVAVTNSKNNLNSSHDASQLEQKVFSLEKELREIKQKIEDKNNDQQELYNKILLPSVKITCSNTIGAGTIVGCKKGEQRWEIFILTAYHVIRKATLQDKNIYVYLADKSIREAEVLCFSEQIDVALLRLYATDRFEYVAEIANIDEALAVKVFTPVYAMGCPLGYEPIPVSGEITKLDKHLNDISLWLMSAPTIYGNSGGGVFLRDTKKLIGITSMVCTYEQPVSTPVPHMSVVTPISHIHKWLEEKGIKLLAE